MEPIERLKQCWKNNQEHGYGMDSIDRMTLEKLVKSRLKKEKNTVIQFFWSSFVYNNLVYALLANLFIRYWGNVNIMLLSVAGIFLFLPFTIILIRKFKKMYLSSTADATLPVASIVENTRNYYNSVSAFFRFKKKYDLFALPVSSVIFVLIIFEMYVTGGIKQHPAAGIISAFILLSIFITAVYFENRKLFRTPLQKLKFIVEDLQNIPPNAP